LRVCLTHSPPHRCFGISAEPKSAARSPESAARSPESAARSYPPQIMGSEPGPGSVPSRDRWRSRQKAIERRQRWIDERDALLESSIETGEHVVARRPAHPLVTDRRILDARQLHHLPRRDEWVVDSLPFDQVTRWSLGAQHDGRPILKLEHHPRTRIDRVPTRRFLWFRWDDAEGPVVEKTTSFGFGRRTNPILLAIRVELERRKHLKDSPS
jgi:hypothetical protein